MRNKPPKLLILFDRSSDDMIDLSSVMLEPAPSSPLEHQIEQEKQIHLEYKQVSH